MTFPFLCCSTATPRRPSPCWTDSTSTPTSPTTRSSPRGSATRRTSTPVRGYLTEFITEYKWFFIKFFQNFQAELAGGWKWNLKFGVPLMNPTHLLMQRFLSPIHLLSHLNSIILSCRDTKDIVVLPFFTRGLQKILSRQENILTWFIWNFIICIFLRSTKWSHSRVWGSSRCSSSVPPLWYSASRRTPTCGSPSSTTWASPQLGLDAGQARHQRTRGFLLPGVFVQRLVHFRTDDQVEDWQNLYAIEEKYLGLIQKN